MSVKLRILNHSEPLSNWDTVTGSKPRLLVADDHEEFLEEVSRLLAGEFDLVGVARDGAELLDRAAILSPDAVVTDFKMPRLTGIVAGRRLVEREVCLAVVLVTMYRDPQLVRDALDAGILGYVLKDRAGDDLIPAIHHALNGKTFVSAL
jgi:DNA-binding NarL/FixJ family response regulator